MKTILIALLIIAVLGGGYYAYTSREEGEYSESAAETEDTGTNTVSGMRAEENAVIVAEQRPGSTVMVAQVYLAAPGYVVIHEDAQGSAGAILGSSALLKAGENRDIAVTLNRPSKDGEKLWAMLHAEKDGNTSFSAVSDTPVESRLGGPISGWFDISATASTDVEITL